MKDYEERLFDTFAIREIKEKFPEKKDYVSSLHNIDKEIHSEQKRVEIGMTIQIQKEEIELKKETFRWNWNGNTNTEKRN